MTLPTNTNAANGNNNNNSIKKKNKNNNHNNNNNNNSSSGSGSSDDDSDMFGPPRCSPPMGYHHHRSRVPMISPKLRQREERKRILQLCAHKLERIKDSEANLRRSVCINNTYCRLTDELRREKQMRYLQNLPKTSDNNNSSSTELARENIFQPNMDDAKPVNNNNNNNSSNKTPYGDVSGQLSSSNQIVRTICSIENHQSSQLARHGGGNTPVAAAAAVARKRQLSSGNLVNDLEILDRELSAINAPMPLIDPEITQGAEQLEKAALSHSRKRLRSQSNEDESDRLVREALQQFYIPPQRLISAIDECPLDVVGLGAGASSGGGSSSSSIMSMDGSKRSKLNGSEHLEQLVDFDMNQNQKDFEVIMDALRLGTPSPSSSASDSCGQAAMMSESASVFHNLVVTSLET
ncbi:CG2865 [Drosophila busckii]|uniref:CG2865 n=1 Tax=Drosophila busckii TaxID=30019 RepID=A0A0M4FA30_DROBS|nr:protein kinase 4 [Drosophila busckii]ALC49525.1 CG2865 [Drosophila busckii]